MKASVFLGASVDGFIARPDGGLDFLDVENPEDHGYEEFAATVDALVMGRNSYDVVLGFTPWPYGGKPVFVLSNRPLSPAPAGAVVERMSGSPADIVAALGARGFQHLYVDGGNVVQQFLRAGLIDRLTITRVPVLIGQGVPIFGTLPADIRLRHISTRSFASGMVQSEYAVIR
jgi:dihydrofolate reductase